MIGEKLSPVLIEIESALWDFQSQMLGQPRFTDDGFKAATKIFIDAMMDKIWDLQSGEKMDAESRNAMALRCGEDLHKLIKTYTNIDTRKFYKEK